MCNEQKSGVCNGCGSCNLESDRETIANGSIVCAERGHRLNFFSTSADAMLQFDRMGLSAKIKAAHRAVWCGACMAYHLEEKSDV